MRHPAPERAPQRGTTARRIDPALGASLRRLDAERVEVTGYALTSRLLSDARIRPGTTGLDARIPQEWRESPVLKLFADMILLSLPPRHGAMRRLVMAWFMPGEVEKLDALITDTADLLIDRAAAAAKDGPVDFVSAVAVPLPLFVIADLIGVPEGDRARLAGWCDRLVQAMWHSVDEIARATGAALVIAKYFRDLLNGRFGPPQGLASRMVEDGSLTEDETIANLVFLVIAATFTTSDFMSSAARFACHDADFRAALRADPRPESAVDEALRLHPPIKRLLRNAAEDVRIGDEVIPEGTLIEFDVVRANRDASVFAEPDRFLPGRPGRKPLSFGHGLHYCAGWALGKAEAAILLARFWQRFDVIEPAGEPVPKDHPFQLGHRSIPLVLR
jgi:cytochrome P450